MNSTRLAKQYDKLKPEERFAVVLAAEARGDDTEAGRLASASKRITLEMNDIAPFLQAFHELELLVFCDLHEVAACVDQYFAMCDAAAQWDTETPKDGESEEGKTSKTKPLAERYLDLALANNYMLKMKKAGWDLFCERLGVPPITLWLTLPGWDRIELALKLAERAAFESADMLVFLNGIRPAGKPKWTELELSAEACADELSESFAKQSHWMAGRK